MLQSLQIQAAISSALKRKMEINYSIQTVIVSTIRLVNVTITEDDQNCNKILQLVTGWQRFCQRIREI